MAAFFAALLAGAPTGAVCAAHVYAPHLRPVAVVAPDRLSIATPAGVVQAPLYLSAAWNVPRPGIERAVIVIHGKLRNADVYYRTAERARAAAGADPGATLLVAPQFLATIDARALKLPDNVLRWKGNAWMGGEPSADSSALSSYAVLDAIARRLADRRLFPHLKSVVFVGHSGGAQVVQRYAVAARGVQALARTGIAVGYVVANPSSYAYFDGRRPAAAGGFAPFDAATCPGFDRWKYGMQARAPYLNDRSPAQLEAGYAKRRVTYLIGGLDTDPAQAALDRSCAAEAQGSNRLARGQAYFHYLRMRHPQGLNQQFHVVPGVGHDGARMLTSPCALAVTFGVKSCTKP
ncbi:MAG: alpha/beta hydrolase [Bordetella sp.]|uniref:alpha/beta hydrolase n=1 Tax=Bordetella sp. TaxID=28081 RepID=UPI003F7CC40D